MRVRFAPSPTGQLHVGNARTALFNWLLARGSSGTFILRVEDTDAERSTPESEAGILRDLRWLGLDWDEGPDVGGPRGPYRQSERLHLYSSYAHELLDGGHAYYCFCTLAQLEAERQEALAAGRPAKYSGTCRRLTPDEAQERLTAGERPAIRFKIPENRDVVLQDAVRGEVRFHTSVLGDPVIVRADGRPAYNFAVVVDDALMEVTHVVRGEDHISNTPRQVLLYEALGFKTPVFAHLALVLGPDHSPLSKRHGATSVAEFRARGYLPEALLNYLALIGWSPRLSTTDDEVMPVDELARRFSLDTVGHSAGVFDEEKLAWVNRHYLKLADPLRLAKLSVAFFQQAGVDMAPDERGLEFLASVMAMASGAVDRLDQVPGRLAFLFDFSPPRALEDTGVREELGRPDARAVLPVLVSELATGAVPDREKFREIAGRIRTRTGIKGQALFHTIRLVLTGRPQGPELDLAVPSIDRGAALLPAGLPPIVGNHARAEAFMAALSEA